MVLDEFKTFFGKYGIVVDAVIMVDHETRKPRGFGFVTFGMLHSN
jgi:RNA recognition motif-containing protein